MATMGWISEVEPHYLIQAYCQGPSFLLWVVASHDITLFLKN